MSTAILAKFQAARATLDSTLIERSNEIDLALTALAAHESALFVGPPGCAKSHTILSLFKWIDAPKFDTILSKFSSPEDVYGPVALSKLALDRYVRNTDRRLPQAHVALFDEVFKASPAIRGTLLRVLNERLFENDGVAIKCPLLSFFAASNEWPNANGDGKEDHAIFDRFIIRTTVKPIASREGREKLRWGGDHIPTFADLLTADELAQTRSLSTKLPWSKESKQCLDEIDSVLAAEGIQAGDRRNYKSIGIASAYAWLNGSDTVQPEHLEVLNSVLWDAPEQEQKTAEVIGKIANPVGQQINALLFEADQILTSVKITDAGQVVTAIKKLGEISKKFATLKSTPKLERALSYVKKNVNSLKVKSLDLI